MIPKAVGILFGALFTLVTAWALGRLALTRLRAHLAREEGDLFAVVAGSGLLSLLILILALVHAIHNVVLLALGAIIIAAAWRAGELRRYPGEPLKAVPRLWHWLFWPVYTVFAVISVIVAMSPEMSPDGASYHLGLVAHYYRQHAMVQVTSDMYAGLSQGLEMLFLNAWAFGRHSAAALVHCAFLLLLPLMIFRFGQRMGVPAAGAAGALFFFCSPVVLVDGTSAYIDIAVAAIVFAIFYLVEIDAPPALVGLLCGFAFAVKYTAFLAIIWVIAVYVWRRRWSAFIPLALAAALLVTPWLARNYFFYSNPVSPLFNSWWPNPFVHISFEQDYVELMRHYPGLESFRQLPLELTVRGEVLGGFFGPLFLLTPLMLLALRKPLGRRVVIAAVLFALPYAANIGTRFLIPSAPFVGLALGMALPGPALMALAVAHAVAGVPDMPKRYIERPGWRVERIPLKQALRIESEDSWLSRRMPLYRVARMVERHTPPGSRIFTPSQYPDSYTTREFVVSFMSAHNERLNDCLNAAMYPDMSPAARQEFSFPRGAYSAIRVVQTAQPRPGQQGEKELWSIAELRVYDGDKELGRAPEWRLDARPNPWDIQLAFDNDPITRWRSWERLRPGMWVSADFGKPREISRVVLTMSTDQWGTKLRAEARDGAGTWRTISSAPVFSQPGTPPRMRRAAIEELKREGIGFMLISEDNFGWQDFRDNAHAWGIREVDIIGNIRLYELE